MNNEMNAEERKEFENLIKETHDLYRLAKRRIDLSHLSKYSKFSHFIYELLQNADDSGAKCVKFVLTEEGLDTHHNGLDFTFQNADDIAKVGLSSKENDSDQIGRFGLGFKSVFAVASAPQIFSGKYNMKIEHYYVLSELEATDKNKKSPTLIRLLFDNAMLTKAKAFEVALKELKNFKANTLLFLNNIERIEWETPSPSLNGFCSKTSERINKKLPNVEKFKLDSTQKQEKYLVLKRPVRIEGRNSSVKIAFQLGKNKSGKGIIVPEKDSKLMAFFPTEKETFLDFLLQGPYTTTPGRDNISEDEENERIILETGKLVAASLPIIRDLGYLNTDFLSMLPIDSEQTDDIYLKLYNKVKDKLLSGKLLPDLQGGHTTPGKAVLADGRGLTEFLKKADLKKLFSRTTWLDTGITSDRTPVLRRYLMNELDVEEVDFRNFASEITEEFLEVKSDKWMADFYNRLLGQKTLWDKNGTQSTSPHYGPILNAKPIIRLETKSDTGRYEHIEPFDSNEKRQVYLPTEPKSSGYKTVKEVFVKDKISCKFLDELGVEKPDIHAEVREFIIPKYQRGDSISVDGCIEDFEKIFRSYTTIRSDEKGALRRELLDTRFILTVESNTSEKYFCKPSVVYFPNDELLAFFKGYESAYFVDSKLLEKDKDGAVAKFLRELGVENRPRHNEIHDLTHEERRELRNGGKFSKEDYKDYIFEGLENFFQSEVTPKKSYLLWRLLLKSIEGMTYEEAKSFFINTYSWQHYGWNPAEFETRSLKILRQTEWLVDKNDNLREPSDLTLSELSDDYEKSGGNASILIEQFQFKLELPPEEQKIVDLERENDELKREKETLKQENDELKKNLEKYEDKKSRKKWEPEVKPDEVSPQIPEPKSHISNNIELRIHENEGIKKAPSILKPAEQLDDFDETEEELQNESLVDKQAIGEWSEKVVYKALKEKYGQRGEVIWLNEKGPGGDHRMGYDMRVEENSSVTMYVEVKGTTQSNPKSIEVQGTQWTHARELYERGDGEKFCFYVVSNAGTSSVKIKPPIKNPYGGWKKGWLQAHPVRLKLPKNIQDD